MIKVTIVIEQDAMAGETPTSWTFEHSMGSTSNPRYVGDAVQLAVVRAATDVCRHMSGMVDLRHRADVNNAAGALLVAVSDA